MNQQKNDTRTIPVTPPGGEAGARADHDGKGRPPSSVDSVLESLGKAITEPIREASEEEAPVSGKGTKAGQQGG